MTINLNPISPRRLAAGLIPGGPVFGMANTVSMGMSSTTQVLPSPAFSSSRVIRFGGNADETQDIFSERVSIRPENLEPDFYKALKALYDKHRRERLGPIEMPDVLRAVLSDPKLKKKVDAAFMEVLMIAPKKLLSLLPPEKKPPGKGEPVVFSQEVEHYLDRIKGTLMAASQAPAKPQNGGEDDEFPGASEDGPSIQSAPLPPIGIQEFAGYFLHPEAPELVGAELVSTMLNASYLRMKNGKPVESVLDQFSRDITLEAEAGSLPPVIGRMEETLKIMTTLNKANSRVPVLVGESGVGKSAIVENLAQLLIDPEKRPAFLTRDDGRGKFLKELEWGKINPMAPEEKMKVLEAIANELMEREDEVVAFIDEFHVLNPPPGSSDRSAEALKPKLSRGKLSLIGATTFSNFSKLQESNTDLAGRLTPVPVNEPDEEMTLTILRGYRDYLQDKHGAIIRDDALSTVASRIKYYITDQKNPKAAIDVVDEAASKAAIENSGFVYADRIRANREYLVTLNQEKGLTRRKAEFEQDLAERETALREATDQLHARIRENKPRDLVANKALIDQVLQRLARPYDFLYIEQPVAEQKLQAFLESELAENVQKTVEARKNLAEKQHELDRINQDLEALRRESENLKEAGKPGEKARVVGPQEVLEVISARAGIPIEKVSQSMSDRVEGLEGRLRKRVVGQQPAVDVIVRDLTKRAVGITKGNKPIGSYLFIGPTGVGKTELAKAVSGELFDSEDIIRFDMSEFMEPHSVSRLFGAPPGYVGFDEGGQLTEAVRRKPYSVVLLDEIEKAHPDVLKTMLQILDDGRLTDGKGRTTDFRNTIIVMTSNTGTEEIMDGITRDDMRQDPENDAFKILFTNLEKKAKRAVRADKQRFKPEFLNRIGKNNLVVFHPLTLVHLEQLVPIMQKKSEKNLQNTGVSLELSDKTRDVMADFCTDPREGGRALGRFFEEVIEKDIADLLVKKRIHSGDTAYVDIVRDADGNPKYDDEDQPLFDITPKSPKSPALAPCL